MTSYAETQGQAPFDWSRLEQVPTENRGMIEKDLCDWYDRKDKAGISTGD